MGAPNCPLCGSELLVVKQSEHSSLNSDQFDSVKAGDWYCTKCPSNGRGNTGYRYFWNGELPNSASVNYERTHLQTAGDINKAMQAAGHPNIAYDSKLPHIRCIVKDCQNHTDQGEFVGTICAACYEHLTTGKVGPTTSILRKISHAELFTLTGPDGKIVTQGQFNALVAENATLKERLETVRLDLVRWAAELGCTMPNAHFKDLLTVIYAKAKERPKSEFAGLLHTAWGIIANANEGDWTKAVPEWKEAAARWRDEYHAFLKSLRR